MGNKWIWIFGGCLLVGLVGCDVWFHYGTKDYVDAVVTKVERVSTGRGEGTVHKYLVFTEGETFQNTDSVWYWKFNSSDMHGHFSTGKYRLTVYGWRVPFLSWYRNIIEAVPYVN